MWKIAPKKQETQKSDDVVSTVIRRQDVGTNINGTSKSADKNNDGIPDYLQRESLPSLLKDIKDTTLAHVDTAKELENLKMRWRGYEYDPNISQFVPVSVPMINEQGIMELSSVLDPLINRHTMNSNISDDWAHKQTERLSINIARLIRNKRKEFGISTSNRDLIVETIDAFFYNVYSRAVNDGQREHDDRRLSLTGSNINSPQQTAGM